MAKLDLTFACVPTDRTRPILDGTIELPGVRIKALPGEPEEIFRRALRDEEFDITEMSMSSHITVTARGGAHYVAIPVFLSRAFRHSAVFIRKDRGIRTPADLAGKRIGIPEYQQTAILWMRGVLRDEHGVGVRDVEWFTGGVNEPLPGERIALSLPPGIRVTPIGPHRTLDELLRNGEVDAVISTRVPACHDEPGSMVVRLFPDYRKVESEYFKRTGFFPIMHTLAVRRRLADENPQLPAALFRAFTAARDRAIGEIGMVNAFRVALPWPAAVLEETKAMLGVDYWPYGFRRCYDEVATMTRYAFEDGLTPRQVAPEELFHPSTHDLAAVASA
jgi:4,5-dihydroxyphthalate decarboxylase